MSSYAVCEILGKQYKIIPNNPLEVDFMKKTPENIDVPVLLLSEEGKVQIGAPHLKEKLTLNIKETVKKEKLRVAKFHAKANYRRVTGIRTKKTVLVWSVM